MNVFVINLDRCTERMSRIAGLLGALGVPFERVAAVDGHRLGAGSGAAAFDGGHGLTRSELACILSHRLAWERFAATADECCLVLEDDVHLGRDFGAIASMDTGLVAASFDVIKLETRNHKIWVDRFDASPVGGDRTIARLHSTHLGTAAYIISRAGVEKALPITKAGMLAVDYILFGGPRLVPTDLRAYQMIPAPAIQDELLRNKPRFVGLPSTIEPERRLARPLPIRKRSLVREKSRPLRRLAENVAPLNLLGKWWRMQRVHVAFE